MRACLKPIAPLVAAGMMVPTAGGSIWGTSAGDGSKIAEYPLDARM